MGIKNLIRIKSLFLDNHTIKQTIFKNTFWLLFAEIISKSLMFFLTIFIARYLGVEGYGKFSFAFTIAALFAVFIDFGFSTLTIRDVAKNRKLVKKYVNNISVIKLALSIVTFSLIFIVMQLLGKTIEVKQLVYLATICTIIQSFTGFFQSVFRAFEKMQYEAISRIIYSLILICIVLVTIWQKLSIQILIQGYIIAALVGLIITYVFMIKRFTRISPNVDFTFWKRLFVETWPFTGSLIFVGIYFRIATVILFMTKGDIAVGLYNAAYNIYFSLIIFPTLFISSVFPIFSKLSNTSVESLKSAYRKSVNYLLTLGLPVAIGNIFLADKIIFIIYGNEFANSALVLKILSWAFLFICLSNPAGNLLDAINKQKKHMVISGFGTVINLLLNVILIFRLSYIGAALSLVITEAIVLFLLLFTINRSIYKTNVFKNSLQIIVASSVMLVFLIIFKNVNIILLISLSAIIYFLILFTLKKISIKFIKLAETI